MKALSVGGAMVDTIAIIESDRIERMSMLNADTSFLLLEEGRKTEALDVFTYAGGGAVNTSVALSRLGFDTSILVKLGRDTRADFLLTRLTDEGVSTRWVIRDADAPTGASVIVSSHDRNAAVFTFRGANTLLSSGDLTASAFAVDLVYISSLSNRSADCFPTIVEKAKANGALVAVNAGVRQLSVRSGTFLESLKKIDILAINRREAEALVPGLVAQFGEGGPTPPLEAGEQPPPLLARGLLGGGYEMSLPAFFKALHSLGTTYVMLTDGLGGAFVSENDTLIYCPAADTTVASTTGAGDAMASTFAAFIALRQPIDVALRAATINASCVVAYIDTQTGLMRREALDARVNANSRLRIRKWRMQPSRIANENTAVKG
ncbi:carbohydrate kinase family protein [Hyphomicrobium sulfonivorans]|nr:carbohydrate kinase family protein [Hyphomicrobium sulfonivorans]NSL71076.1 carbohydrate kinase family protein [Hyphomicrobium sulfonivorans]